MEDLYDEYNELHKLTVMHEESKETTRQSLATTRQIAARIRAKKAEIERREAAIANMSANQRRAWIRRVNRGAVWAGTAGAASALREVARESPAITAAIGGVVVGAGATATALAIGFGGSQPPPIAGPRPSVSIPAAQPSVRPTDTPESRQSPNRPRPERPPRAVVIPVRAEPSPRPERGRPKVPPVVPAPVPAPPEEAPPPVAAAESPHAPTCLADVRVLVVSARLFCGPA